MSLRLLAGLSLLALVGCVSVKGDKAVVPPTGLYSHFRAPLAANVRNVPCKNLRSGTGDTSVYIHDWVYSGLGADVYNMALQSAIRNGGLEEVYFADYEQHSLFGFVTFFSVTAYGKSDIPSWETARRCHPAPPITFHVKSE